MTLKHDRLATFLQTHTAGSVMGLTSLQKPVVPLCTLQRHRKNHQRTIIEWNRSRPHVPYWELLDFWCPYEQSFIRKLHLVNGILSPWPLYALNCSNLLSRKKYNSIWLIEFAVCKLCSMRAHLENQNVSGSRANKRMPVNVRLQAGQETSCTSMRTVQSRCASGPVLASRHCRIREDLKDTLSLWWTTDSHAPWTGGPPGEEVQTRAARKWHDSNYRQSTRWYLPWFMRAR